MKQTFFFFLFFCFHFFPQQQQQQKQSRIANFFFLFLKTHDYDSGDIICLILKKKLSENQLSFRKYSQTLPVNHLLFGRQFSHLVIYWIKINDVDFFHLDSLHVLLLQLLLLLLPRK